MGDVISVGGNLAVGFLGISPSKGEAIGEGLGCNEWGVVKITCKMIVAGEIMYN